MSKEAANSEVVLRDKIKKTTHKRVSKSDSESEDDSSREMFSRVKDDLENHEKATKKSTDEKHVALKRPHTAVKTPAKRPSTNGLPVKKDAVLVIDDTPDVVIQESVPKKVKAVSKNKRSHDKADMARLFVKEHPCKPIPQRIIKRNKKRYHRILKKRYMHLQFTLYETIKILSRSTSSFDKYREEYNTKHGFEFKAGLEDDEDDEDSSASETE